MIYKKIFLSLLLVPLTAMSNATDARELEKKILQKELELSKLGALITEKDKLLVSFELEVQNLFQRLLDKKTEQLEEKNHNPLTQEEKEKLSTELWETTIKFVNIFGKDYQNQKDIKNSLTKGLVEESNNGTVLEFASFRFYLIRCHFEQSILKHLIAEYEYCLQELRTLENALKN